MAAEPADSASSNADSRRLAKPTLSNREFQTPADDGAKLIEPSADRLPQVWNDNLAGNSVRNTILIDQTPLGTLKTQARQELIQLARDYSGRYLDLTQATPGEPQQPQPIIMAGHQPTLFHAGVWLKNFFLSQQARRLNALPINLIVDQDLCDSRSIQVPTGTQTPQQITAVPLDRESGSAPFEFSVISDDDWFRSAGSRIEAAIKPLIDQPIAKNLWPEINTAMNQLSDQGRCNFGAALAAGRHRLEASLGLKSWEVPISLLSQTPSFAKFVWQILTDATQFLAVHNQGLAEYRKRFDLRSKTHPFPDLRQNEDWLETPFWMFANSMRSPLYCRTQSTGIELSDLKGWSLKGLTESADLITAMREGRAQIRPRAITTTLYSRLVLSDLFVHGIGGGKYDLLTDWIATKLWQIQLPDFCVVSGTFQLFPGLTGITVEQIQQRTQQLRESEMHPEKFLAADRDRLLPAEVQSASAEKQAWIRGQRIGSAKDRHFAISECNRILNEWLRPWREREQAKLAADRQSYERQQVFRSREFSFCLHSVKRIEQLLEC